MEIQRNRNFNYLIQINDELYNFKEDKIPLDKYTNLLKLYEQLKKENKTLENDYLKTIKKINANLLKFLTQNNSQLNSDNIKDIIFNDKKTNEKNFLNFDYNSQLN